MYNLTLLSLVNLIYSTELYRNSKFCFEISSSALLSDSIIHLACSALLHWAKPAGQGSFFKVCEIVLLWCRLPSQLLVPVLVLSHPSYSVLPLSNWVNICECFGTILWIFRGHSWKSHFEANYRGLEAAEDVQPSLNKFSTSQGVSDIPATPTGSPGKKFFICETFSLDASSRWKSGRVF